MVRVSPILHIHLYLNTTVIRRTSGQSWELSNKAVLFRMSGSSGRKSVFTLRGVMLPPCWCWGFRSSGLLRWVTGYWFPTFRMSIPSQLQRFLRNERRESVTLLLSITHKQRSLNFSYRCADLLLLLAEDFYTIWRLRITLKVLCKNIYNENWKIPAAQQEISVHGSISVTGRPYTRAARREHCSQVLFSQILYFL
jgi:hypothetical protein